MPAADRGGVRQRDVRRLLRALVVAADDIHQPGEREYLARRAAEYDLRILPAACLPDGLAAALIALRLRGGPGAEYELRLALLLRGLFAAVGVPELLALELLEHQPPARPQLERRGVPPAARAGAHAVVGEQARVHLPVPAAEDPARVELQHQSRGQSAGPREDEKYILRVAQRVGDLVYEGVLLKRVGREEEQTGGAVLQPFRGLPAAVALAVPEPHALGEKALRRRQGGKLVRAVVAEEQVLAAESVFFRDAIHIFARLTLSSASPKARRPSAPSLSPPACAAASACRGVSCP